jgi:hypothetical protein
MIKKFNDFNEIKGYSDSQRLPRGGYVCKIIGAKPIETKFGQSIKVAFDITEGEFAGYYQQKYDANKNEDKKWPGTFLLNVPSDDGSTQDGWTKRKFRTFTDALEDSNPGYHFDWDEQKLKGKLIGGLFNIRQYEKRDGSVGSATNLARLCKVYLIREGTYTLPADKIIDAKQLVTTNADGFMDIPEGSGDELPF